MRIDWRNGRWHVWSMDGTQIADVGHLTVIGSVEFVSIDNNSQGIALTVGDLTVAGDRAIIREKGHGEGHR